MMVRGCFYSALKFHLFWHEPFRLTGCFCGFEEFFNDAWCVSEGLFDGLKKPAQAASVG